MERYFLAALGYVTGCGNSQIKVLYKHFGSAENIWRADSETLSRCKFLGEASVDALLNLKKRDIAARLQESCLKNGIRIISYLDDDYPEALQHIVNAPAVLYVKGQPITDSRYNLGVVGPRDYSAYGQQVTEYLLENIAPYNIGIVSGGARGIDSIAHQAALKNGLYTAAVLGCGLDIIYPAENKTLFAQIAEQGTLISEYPPGVPPLPKNFPARNRIVSGLSKGVLVAEAALKSGALITAEFAMDQGREVYCVPGSIFAPQTVGVHSLLKQGAKLVNNVRDILEDYFDLQTVRKAETKTPPVYVQQELTAPLREQPAKLPPVTENLSAEQQRVLAVLSYELPLSIEQVMLESEMPVGDLNLVLLELEILGMIRADAGSRKYVKIRGVC